MLVFLIRIGLGKVDVKEQKITYNEAVIKKVLAQVKEAASDKTIQIIEQAQLDDFIGAYSFITEVKKDIRLVPGICSRQLTTPEQKLSLGENAHKIKDKQPAQEANTEWINKSKDISKPVQISQQGIISVNQLGAEFSSEDD